MRTLKTAFLSALCAALLASPAHAEKADRDKPVTLEADTVTIDDIRKISVYEGNVILSQGTLLLRADRVQVTQSADGLDKVVATGRPVSFRQKLDGRDEFIDGYANRIEYAGVNSQLELIGQARLRRDGDGQLRIARTYTFEFSDTGNNRRHGAIVMLGGELQDLQLEPYRIQ